MIKLSKLLHEHTSLRDTDIAGVTADSRTVKPGYLFAALPGTQVDGADYILKAIKAGAVAVLCRPDAVRADVMAAHDSVIWIREDIPAQVFAHIAARFFDQQPETVAAVTGTNGKTSVAAFTKQIWEHMGFKSGSVGTLGINGPDSHQDTGMTTPDPVTLQKAMRDLCEAGVDHVVFEASSHGLAQYRLDGMNVSVAAFTNLTRDHFDYHGTQEEYFNAKARLFGEVMKPGSVAVLNADCPLVMEVADICGARGHKVITIGHHSGDIRLLRQQTSEVGQDITIGYQGEIYDLTLPLVGSFQAMNALMAVGLVIGSGGNVDQAFEALSHLRAVEGRMEQAGRHKSGARIYVDYAHTPDALETVLTAMRPHVKNKLAVVFGCGGDRDKGKRLIMGEVAAQFADRTYVTDDNPRGETAADIRDQIMQGCPGAMNIGDRASAIGQAIADLKNGDILLVAGKGHEQGQIIDNKVVPFDDIAEIRSALAAAPLQPSPQRRYGA
ncbi:UDP-N-acetylmuramoyl-L-alanyl-D-glutamate--2,6-diaminopimelate ligase [Paremcibacter congregatus]|uniref:UDP-N-acetylmuramoyl-L-alanyl-D-glutamate--2, 6-diaminopimelate ligase n=1 Tax=Paremcibacter congregatus TaxID=2043170 RepID=UPI003A9056F4|tara:strand:- start:3381 stop:4871 length:1491 start_codon:yes stop_codon:yes gene_type:complete